MSGLLAVFLLIFLVVLSILIWVSDPLILIFLPILLLLVGIKNTQRVAIISRYFLVLLAIIFPINFLLNYSNFSNLLHLILYSMLPALRILFISLLFILYDEYIGIDDMIDGLSKLLPRSITLAVSIAFMLIPVYMKELEDIYTYQMLRGLAQASFRKRIVYTVKAVVISSVMLAINRAIRIAEAVELYY